MPIWSIWQFPRGTPEGTQDPNGVGFRLFWRPRFIRSSGTAASILASRDRGRSRCRHPASEGPLRSGQYRGESPRSPRPHGQRAPSGGDLPDVRQAGTQEASFPSPPPRSSRATCRAVEPRVPPRDRRILASGPRSGRTTHEAGRIPGPGGSNAPACRPSPGTSYSPSSDSARERAVLGRSQLLPLLPYPVLTAPRHHPRSLVKPTLGMSLVLEVNGCIQTENPLWAAASWLAVYQEMQKSVYTHTCIHLPWNPSYSRSSPIRPAAGSWRRSGPASAPCTRSWKPWSSSNRASRGIFASFTRRGSGACGRRGKSASIGCARGHSAGWTNGCDSTAACGRPASTGSTRNSIDDKGRGPENAGRYTHDQQQEDAESQGREHRAKDHHVPDVQRPGRGGCEALCLDLQEFKDHQPGPRGGGRSDHDGAGAERDVRTRRSAIHGHGRRPVLLVRAGNFPLRELRHAGRNRPVVGEPLGGR